MEDSRGRSRSTEDSNNKEKTNCHRGHWRPAEDEKLKQLVHQFGPQNWNSIAENLPGRSGKSCRLRWFNQLDPKINKKPFTEEEGKRLLAAQKIHGNRWALISRLFPGRTDNAIKNHYHIIKAREQRSLTVLPYASTISSPSTGTNGIHNNNNNNHHPYSAFGRFLQRYYSKPNHNYAITPPTTTSTARSSSNAAIFMALPPNKRQRVPEEFSFFPSSMSSKSGFMSNSSPQSCNNITTIPRAPATAGTGSKVNNQTMFDNNVHGRDQRNIKLSSFDLQRKDYMLCKCNDTIAGGCNGHDIRNYQGPPPAAAAAAAAACNSTAPGNKNFGSLPPGFKAMVISTSIHDRSDQEQDDADEEEYRRKDVPYINFF